MDIKEIAEKLNGLGYREEPAGEIIEAAKSDGIVIIFGVSDDLMEFRGAIDDEVGSYDGTKVYISEKDLVRKPDCDCEWAEEWYEQRIENAKAIRACWCKKDEVSWTYETDIPHETFNIFEDGEIYCIGIVFYLSRAEKAFRELSKDLRGE